MAANLKNDLHFPVWLSQVCYHCWTDCALGGEYLKSLREEETPLWESAHGMRRQMKGFSIMPIEGCHGFINWTKTSCLTRLRLTNRTRWRATQQLQSAAERTSCWIRSKVGKTTTSWQNLPPSLAHLNPYAFPWIHPLPLRHPYPTSTPDPLGCRQSIPQYLLLPVTSPSRWSCCGIRV